MNIQGWTKQFIPQEKPANIFNRNIKEFLSALESLPQ